MFTRTSARCCNEIGGYLQHFFIVQTKPNCEEHARRFLTADHFNVYYPRVLVRRAHGGKVDHVPRPLFARYVFIGDDGRRGVYFFRSAPGVASVVTRGNEPVRVGRTVVDELKSRECDDGFIKIDDGALSFTSSFKNGKDVRIALRAPAFGGFNAIFGRKMPGDRAAVFINLLGRSAKLMVSLNDLEKL